MSATTLLRRYYYSANTDVTAPTFSAFFLSDLFAFGAYFRVNTDEANGTMYAVVTDNDNQPSVAQIQAGQDGLGASAVAAGSWTVTSTNFFPLSEPLTGLQHNTTYYLFAQQQDAAGNDSVVTASVEFTTVDANPSAVRTGATTGRGSADADYNTGTWYWIVDQSATPPSVAQIQAGNDSGGVAADDAGSEALDANEVDTFDFTGLTGGVLYYAYAQYQADDYVDVNQRDSPVFLLGSFTPGTVTVRGSSSGSVATIRRRRGRRGHALNPVLLVRDAWRAFCGYMGFR